MPVSHLGLTVSHIPSATSFYLSALQPLGYRFIGHQGDSIGLGIDSADLFLTQAPIGTRPSPNHIAFLADSRLVVRDCYSAALNSGGLPSGAPSYRNTECACFNAAVEDFDGNTIEFINRQPHGENGCCGGTVAPEGSRVLDWQKDVAQSVNADDTQSIAQSMVSRGSLASKASRAKSRMSTALDLASTTSKSVKSETPSRGISRTNTAPAISDFPSKTLIGTALGAAAGAAIMFAMTRTESENARREADHLAYMSSKSRRRHSVDEKRPPPPKAETVAPSLPPPLAIAPSQAAKSESRQFHRNYSVTESAYSRRPPPQATQAMRMIEATGYNDSDDVQEALSRHNSLRPKATRSRTTYDDYIYVPASAPARSAAASSSHTIKRASTLPVQEPYYLDPLPPKSSVSKHSSNKKSHHESSAKSSNSRRPPSPPPKSSHSSRHSRRHAADDDENDDENISRHDSVHSHRSRRSHHDPARRSSASTIKPSRQTAQLPPAPSKSSSRAPSTCYFPAAISLPPSTVIPPPLAASKESWEDFVAEESDGMGDVKTVVPDDSISMVDVAKSRRRRRRGEGGGRGSRV